MQHRLGRGLEHLGQVATDLALDGEGEHHPVEVEGLHPSCRVLERLGGRPAEADLVEHTTELARSGFGGLLGHGLQRLEHRVTRPQRRGDEVQRVGKLVLEAAALLGRNRSDQSGDQRDGEGTGDEGRDRTTGEHQGDDPHDGGARQRPGDGLARPNRQVRLLQSVLDLPQHTATLGESLRPDHEAAEEPEPCQHALFADGARVRTES